MSVYLGWNWIFAVILLVIELKHVNYGTINLLYACLNLKNKIKTRHFLLRIESDDSVTVILFKFSRHFVFMWSKIHSFLMIAKQSREKNGKEIIKKILIIMEVHWKYNKTLKEVLYSSTWKRLRNWF